MVCISACGAAISALTTSCAFHRASPSSCAPSMEESRRARSRAKHFAAIALLLVVAAAAVGPIRSYDFFWHLATGRWIVEHHALPLYDPFTLAGAHVPWINGEWLYEIGLYGAHSAFGLPGVSWV